MPGAPFPFTRKSWTWRRRPCAARLPIQTCWPEDAGPLITWPLVVTKGPNKERVNLGIYRQQVIGRNRVIMRWLAHRGGALDFKDWREAYPDRRFPVSVALGADASNDQAHGCGVAVGSGTTPADPVDSHLQNAFLCVLCERFSSASLR